MRKDWQAPEIRSLCPAPLLLEGLVSMEMGA